MIFYYIFSFLLCLWLGFANDLCILIRFFFFCVCGLVLPILYASLFIFLFIFFSAKVSCFFTMFYASLFIFFSFFCVCVLVMPMFYASYYVFISFLFCLCLAFAKALCLFI